MPGFELFGDEERKEVGDVLETGVLFRYGFDQARQGHWKAKTFEEELARMLKVNHCHLVSSGTTALITALSAAGVGAGDEVIVPTFTFVATVEAVFAAGAVPVFADIDDTLCLDPASVRSRITRKTKAVVPVHMCGAMADILALKAICDEKDLILMEDACQSLGGTLYGKALGTFGRAGCFSFDPVKTITAGEGGAVVTNDTDLYINADQFADHGHDHVGNDRGAETHPITGSNFRISELNAAVALAQLRKLDKILEIQRKNKTVLKEALGQCRDISFRRLPDPDGDTATFLSFFLPDEDSARNAAREMAAAGVPGAYWFDNNWHYIRQWDHFRKMSSPGRLPQTLYENAPDYASTDTSASDAVMGRCISMQIMLGWSGEELAACADKLRQVFGG